MRCSRVDNARYSTRLAFAGLYVDDRKLGAGTTRFYDNEAMMFLSANRELHVARKPFGIADRPTSAYPAFEVDLASALDDVPVRAHGIFVKGNNRVGSVLMNEFRRDDLHVDERQAHGDIRVCWIISIMKET